MTAAPLLSMLVMMISSLRDSSLIAFPSPLSRFGCGCLGLKVYYIRYIILQLPQMYQWYDESCLVSKLCFYLF